MKGRYQNKYNNQYYTIKDSQTNLLLEAESGPGKIPLGSRKRDC